MDNGDPPPPAPPLTAVCSPCGPSLNQEGIKTTAAYRELGQVQGPCLGQSWRSFPARHPIVPASGLEGLVVWDAAPHPPCGVKSVWLEPRQVDAATSRRLYFHVALSIIFLLIFFPPIT